MKKKGNNKFRLYQRVLSLILSVVIGLGTFVSLTVSNAKLLDILHIRNIITAYADEETLPQFYREGELVGIYNPDYTSTDTIYYRIGEGDTWTAYEVPVAIPAFTTTAVYAKIGENGTVNGENFTSSRLAIGAYTESNTDFSITYNNLTFDFYRNYDSRTNEWFFGNRWELILEDSLIEATLINGEKLHFVRKGNVYYNELNSYTITISGNQAVLNADNNSYIYSGNGSFKSLSRIEDSSGNYFTIGSTLSRTDVSDPKGRHYLIGSGDTSVMVGDITLDEEVFAMFKTNDPKHHDFEYYLAGHNSDIYDNKYLDRVVDQAGVIISKYEYYNDNVNGNHRLKKSNDKTIDYNADGRVSSIVYDSGEAITYTYNDTQKSYTESSNQGGSTTTVYNDAFLPVSVSDGITTTTYTYDSKYRLASETTDNVTITYTYDNNGNLVSSVSSDTENGSSTRYTYYSNGKVKREQTGNDYTYYVYNSNGDVTISATLKENYTGTIPEVYDNTLTCFDVTEYNYDSNGRLIETSSENSTESYTYDQYGNTTSVETEYTEDNETVTTQTDYTYDVLGNVTSSTQDNETTTYTYDDAGRTLLVNDNGKCTRTLYDDYGRVVQEIGPEDYDSTKDGLPSANTYADSNVGQRYHYNEYNQVDYETNRLGVKTDYTYYDNGIKETEKFDIYEYYYNEAGNISKIKLKNTTTPYAEYTYDDPTKTILQSIAYGNGQTVLYDYDQTSGKLKAQKYKASANTDPVTQFVYEYGTDGELSAKIDLNSERYTAYSNNTVTVSELVTTENNNETEYSAGTLIYSYTDTEEVTENGVTTPASSTKAYNGNTVGITYNESSTAYTINNSSLFNLTETNDEANHTSSTVLKDSSDNTLFSNSYTYDTDGNVTGMTSGGVSTSYVYDSKGRITEYHQGNEAAYYTYDSKGQLIREDLNYARYPKTLVYTYDARGNITKTRKYAYTRDSLDNLQDITNMDFEYEDGVWLDEVESAGQYDLIYDENGNPVDISGISLEWTNGRQLAETSYIYENVEYPVSSYAYDDEGIRTKRTEWETTTYYTTEDGKITSQYELDSQGNKQNEIIFIYDGDEVISALYAGETFYYVKNAMGDVIALVNEDGETMQVYRYTAYGDETEQYLGADSEERAYFCCNNPFTYRSYYQDDDGFGAYYLQSRYYEDQFSRFLNADIPDIAQQSKGEINGLNLFAYCNNDPVNNVDPMGYWSVTKNNGRFLVYGKLVLPKYEPNKWNSKKIRNSTNCYAYALNIYGVFPNNYYLNPGNLSNKPFYEYSSRYLDKRMILADQVIQAAKADLKRLGHKLVPDSCVYKGGYRVALVTSVTDYHWYREDKKNSWSHKLAHNNISKYDANNKLIVNPKNACRKYSDLPCNNYSYFAGYFRIV